MKSELFHLAGGIGYCVLGIALYVYTWVFIKSESASTTFVILSIVASIRACWVAFPSIREKLTLASYFLGVSSALVAVASIRGVVTGHVDVWTRAALLVGMMFAVPSTCSSAAYKLGLQCHRAPMPQD